MGIAGPGDIKHTNFYADWHLFFADLTALPAAAAIIEKLPETAVGTASIQVPTEDNKQAITAPEDININWIINDDLNKKLLLKQAESYEWRNGKPAIFIAMENSQRKQSSG